MSRRLFLFPLIMSMTLMVACDDTSSANTNNVNNLNNVNNVNNVNNQDLTYAVVDTGQTACYGDTAALGCVGVEQAFGGQDAQFRGLQPAYTDHGDGTVTDRVTGLMWVKTPDLNADGVIDVEDKLTWSQIQARVVTLNEEAFAGHTDWRLPTIKELYSLIDFRGTDPSKGSASRRSSKERSYFGLPCARAQGRPGNDGAGHEQ